MYANPRSALHAVATCFALRAFVNPFSSKSSDTSHFHANSIAESDPPQRGFKEEI